MRLLVIENDHWCPPHQERFINALAELKQCNDITYCYGAKEAPEFVLNEINRGVDYIVFTANVIDIKQWIVLIDFFTKHQVNTLKEIHANDVLGNIERNIRAFLPREYINKLKRIELKGIHLKVSKQNFLDDQIESHTLDFNRIL